MLKYILEQKFLSRDQIIRWFYKSKDANKRLWEVGLAGYLKKAPVVLNSKDHFLIKSHGLRALAERGTNGIRPASSIDIRFYFHDRTVTDLRLLFESIGLARDWKSEKVLRSELGALKVPDGVFLSPAGKKIAFELELTPKENSRYKEILSEYQNVDRAFYVVRGEALFMRLKGLMRNKMLICKLEDIERDPLKTEVFWGNERMTIKELIDAK
ncbi:MAG: hypothetical protein HZA00_02980 [Nitrospinae bacterium]|nr:hypothetical protein [Nitrospinota bacterium]